jgi:uncharacterized MAPEG superfamily protein
MYKLHAQPRRVLDFEAFAVFAAFLLHPLVAGSRADAACLCCFWCCALSAAVLQS